MRAFDLIVLGTGPSGSSVAVKCARAGWSVAIVEPREFGGTCALRGCNPKKVLVHAAELIDAVRRNDGMLIEDPGAKIDWPRLFRFKESFVKSIPESSLEKFREAGIECIAGTGRFAGPDTIAVGTERYRAKRILVATGATPRPLDFPGAEHLIGSDEFLNLESLPQRVVFIGGGYISLEFAHVAVRAGATVTVLEEGSQILTPFDEELVDHLTEHSRSIGIDLQTGTSHLRVDRAADGATYELQFERGGAPQTITCDVVVHGAGRVPNIAALDLENAGVESDENGILVDETLRSVSQPQVFATGDCAATGKPPLTPVANKEARTLIKNWLAEESNPVDYGPIPAVVYTVPALASVGYTEAKAKELGFEFDVHRGQHGEWSTLRKINQPCGYYKFLVDQRTNTLLGAHLLGPSAEETINLVTLAMAENLTIDRLTFPAYAFPTFSTALTSMI